MVKRQSPERPWGGVEDRRPLGGAGDDPPLGRREVEDRVEGGVRVGVGVGHTGGVGCCPQDRPHHVGVGAGDRVGERAQCSLQEPVGVALEQVPAGPGDRGDHHRGVFAASLVSGRREVDGTKATLRPEVDEARRGAVADTQVVEVAVGGLRADAVEQERAEPPRAGDRVGGDSEGPPADRDGRPLVATLRGQHVGDHVSADALTGVHPRPPVGGQPALPGQKRHRDDVSVAEECANGDVRRVEQPCEVVRLGPVVGGHEQAKGLPQQVVVGEEGLGREAAVADTPRVGVGDERADGWAGGQCERTEAPHLDRVGRGVANRRVESDLPYDPVTVGKPVAKAHVEAPTRPLVAVDGGGKGDRRRVEQCLETADGEGGGLVDEDGIGVIREVDCLGGRAKADPAVRGLESARVLGSILSSQRIEVRQQLPGAGEQFAGVAVGGRGDEYVLAVAGETGRGQPGGTRLATPPVGLEDECLERLERGDRVGLVGRPAGLVGGGLKPVVVGRLGGRRGSAGRGVRQPLRLDGAGLDVDESDPTVGPECVDKPAPEVARHVGLVEGRDRKRRVEAVPTLRPARERRGQQQ